MRNGISFALLLLVLSFGETNGEPSISDCQALAPVGVVISMSQTIACAQYILSQCLIDWPGCEEMTPFIYEKTLVAYYVEKMRTPNHTLLENVIEGMIKRYAKERRHRVYVFNQFCPDLLSTKRQSPDEIFDPNDKICQKLFSFCRELIKTTNITDEEKSICNEEAAVELREYMDCHHEPTPSCTILCNPEKTTRLVNDGKMQRCNHLIQTECRYAKKFKSQCMLMCKNETFSYLPADFPGGRYMLGHCEPQLELVCNRNPEHAYECEQYVRVMNLTGQEMLKAMKRRGCSTPTAQIVCLTYLKVGLTLKLGNSTATEVLSKEECHKNHKQPAPICSNIEELCSGNFLQIPPSPICGDHQAGIQEKNKRLVEKEVARHNKEVKDVEEKFTGLVCVLVLVVVIFMKLYFRATPAYVKETKAEERTMGLVMQRNMMSVLVAECVVINFAQSLLLAYLVRKITYWILSLHIILLLLTVAEVVFAELFMYYRTHIPLAGKWGCMTKSRYALSFFAFVLIFPVIGAVSEGTLTMTILGVIVILQHGIMSAFFLPSELVKLSSDFEKEIINREERILALMARRDDLIIEREKYREEMRTDPSFVPRKLMDGSDPFQKLMIARIRNDMTVEIKEEAKWRTGDRRTKRSRNRTPKVQAEMMRKLFKNIENREEEVMVQEFWHDKMAAHRKIFEEAMLHKGCYPDGRWIKVPLKEEEKERKKQRKTKARRQKYYLPSGQPKPDIFDITLTSESDTTVERRVLEKFKQKKGLKNIDQIELTRTQGTKEEITDEEKLK